MPEDSEAGPGAAFRQGGQLKQRPETAQDRAIADIYTRGEAPVVNPRDSLISGTSIGVGDSQDSRITGLSAAPEKVGGLE